MPLSHQITAPLDDIHAFVEGQVNYNRIDDLMLPMTAIDWSSQSNVGTRAQPPIPPTISRVYATLKLLFLPWEFQRNSRADGIGIPPEPSILPLLRGDCPRDAYQVACRRLQSSDLTPSSHDIEVHPDQGGLLAAALLIPIRHRDMYELARLALMPEKQ